jgi:Cu/Ag efflux pump CusA
VTREITATHVTSGFDLAADCRPWPTTITAVVITVGLAPGMFDGGTSSDMLGFIATRVVRGMVTGLLLSTIVLPAIHGLMRRHGRAGYAGASTASGKASMQTHAPTAA